MRRKMKRRISSMKSMWKQRKFLKNPPSDTKKVDNLVISLTSFSKRFEGLPFVIASVMNQSVRAEKVILWLDEGEEKMLPKSIHALKELGLEIHETPKQTRSYRKLLPTLEMYKTSDIITVDDDIMYAQDWLEPLVTEARGNERGVYSYVTRKIAFEQSRKLKPYSEWKRNDASSGRYDAKDLPIGYGGVFYPASIFNDEVFNEKVFLKLAPCADDLWFKIMTLLSGHKSFQLKKDFGTTSFIPNTQEHGLWKNNASKNENQIQLERLLDHYDLWDQVQQ